MKRATQGSGPWERQGALFDPAPPSGARAHPAAETLRGLRRRVFEAVYLAGPLGMTCDEVEIVTARPHQSVVRAQEDHRAVVEALETYEERIGDIADHVLGLVPSGTPTVVKLDAIERRCGEERIAARQAEARVAELKGIVSDYEELHDPLIAIADAAEALVRDIGGEPGRWERCVDPDLVDTLWRAALAARGSR